MHLSLYHPTGSESVLSMAAEPLHTQDLGSVPRTTKEVSRPNSPSEPKKTTRMTKTLLHREEDTYSALQSERPQCNTRHGGERRKAATTQLPQGTPSYYSQEEGQSGLLQSILTAFGSVTFFQILKINE